MKFTVAIDGPAAAGKGTISKAVAQEFGFAHLDTGLLYRAVGMMALDSGEVTEANAVAAARNLSKSDLQQRDLRGATAADAASKVAALSQVRALLLNYQKTFASQDGGAVLDGRDIGTVICPDAEVKLFVTASADVRAKRRFDELAAGGSDVTLAVVLHDVMARDARDANRTHAPMKAAAGAQLIDTSDLSIQQAVERAVAAVKIAMPAR